MYVMRSLIGIDRLQVCGVAHHVEFGTNSVAAMHVARDPGDIQRLAAIVALDEADRLGNEFALPRAADRRAAPPEGPSVISVIMLASFNWTS